MSLALSHFAITANRDGTVTIGAITVPAGIAHDLATRIYEAAGDVPAAVEGRIRCRVHLDRVFARAEPVHLRDMQTGETGRFVAIRDGRRLVVRLGDTATAVLLSEGERWRGFGMQWRDDPIFGPVAELALPMRRYSCAGLTALSIQGHPHAV